MATGQKYTFRKKATATATGNSGWVKIGSSAVALVLRVKSDQGTGTTPTLDWTVRTNKTGADTGDRLVHQTAFTQVTGASGAKDEQRRLSDIDAFVKVIFTITGTTPSFLNVEAIGIIERKFAV